MRPLAVLFPLALVVACAPSRNAEPAAPPPLAPLPAASAAGTAPPPPAEEQRCAQAPRRPTDNMNVVIEDTQGELTSALARPPLEAAASWADVLQRLSKDCAGTEVEHPLPSTRVTLRTPRECRAGAAKNELVFEFVAEGNGSAVDAAGNVTSQGRPLRVEARVTPAPAGKALCATGRIDLGAPGAPARSDSPPEDAGPEAVMARQRWLVVPFQLVGGVVGLLPLGR